MISLRHKLWIGFGGLVIVLLVVSALSAVVLTRYAHTLEEVFQQNYYSAVYCTGMKDSLDQLNLRAQALIWGEDSANRINADAQTRKFEENLRAQIENSYLPGEVEKTRELESKWLRYKAGYAQLDRPGARVADLYRQDLLPLHEAMMQVAQEITDMNMVTMASRGGQVKRTLLGVRNALIVLVIVGALLAAGVVWAAGAAILNPLSALTRSAKQIEAGNLDLNLEFKSNDEIGQLAEAFNSMAARLREFRRTDHHRLVRTQRTTQLAIDSLPDAVFIIGPDERVEISNRTARTHFHIEPGSTVAELRLKWLTPLYESIKRDRKPIEPQGYKAAIQLFENGEERFLLPRAVPMLGDNDELIGVTVILVDLTRLRHADEAKSGMISTVSHELRTPLTGVRMSLSLMANDKLGEVPPKHKRLIVAAREDSDRLYRIIENLLNISRIEAGRSQFQFRAMSAAEIVSHAADPLRPAFAEKGLRLDVHVPADLPDVNADPTAIGSALTNLLSNALKFTPAGGAVTVAADSDNDSVSFSVTDNGPGIPPQFRDHVFEKFFRVPRKGGPGGAGLGLTIAREIVEAHGGQLDFECPQSSGVTFRFRLPRRADPNSAGETLKSFAKAGEPLDV